MQPVSYTLLIFYCFISKKYQNENLYNSFFHLKVGVEATLNMFCI